MTKYLPESGIVDSGREANSARLPVPMQTNSTHSSVYQPKTAGRAFAAMDEYRKNKLIVAVRTPVAGGIAGHVCARACVACILCGCMMILKGGR